MLVGGALTGAAAAQQASSAVEPTPVRLVWRWMEGKTYRFETRTETLVNLAALNQPGEQVLQVIQDTSIRVRRGQKPGTKELEVRFDELRARMTAGEKTFLYDSEEPSESDPALRQMLTDSTGRSFTLVYSSEDRFLEIGAVDQPAAAPDREPSLAAVADARQVAELYRRSLEMVLPRPEVLPGDKWQSIEQVKFPQAGDMNVKMSCHYAEVLQRDGRPHAKITYQGRLGQSPEGAATKKALKLGGESTISGHLFYDLERGAVSLSMFLGSIVIEHEGRNLPVRQSVTTRLEAIEDSERP